jgi:hypothetical protein
LAASQTNHLAFPDSLLMPYLRENQRHRGCSAAGKPDRQINHTGMTASHPAAISSSFGSRRCVPLQALILLDSKNQMLRPAALTAMSLIPWENMLAGSSLTSVERNGRPTSRAPGFPAILEVIL